MLYLMCKLLWSSNFAFTIKALRKHTIKLTSAKFQKNFYHSPKLKIKINKIKNKINKNCFLCFRSSLKLKKNVFCVLDPAFGSFLMT